MAKKSREEIDHYTLDQYEQEKHLGIGHEMTKNLGHDWRESEIEQNPAGKLMNYDSADTTRVINEPRSQGVYGRFKNPLSGIAEQRNLSRWAGYARSNSYHRGPGPGREPTVRDQGRSSVPSAARSKDSDGYLESTRNWPSFEYGSESGLGRIEKTHRK